MRHALTLPLTLATLLALGGCAIIVMPEDGAVRYESVFGASAVQGNGQAGVERREAAGADRLDISGPLQVEVRVGADASLQVEGDANLLTLLRTDTRGDTLRVWVDSPVRSNNPLRVVYTTPQLRQVVASGAGRLEISGLHGGPLSLTQSGSRSTQLSGQVSQLELRMNGSGAMRAAGLDSGTTLASLNGSGRLELGQVRGDSLSVDLHGSGGVSASGSVRALTVQLFGSGSADLAGLSAQRADLRSRGSGSISAAASETLAADATGSGRITVYGNPAQRSVSGQRVSVLQ
jgi:hypothetical protein